MAERRLSERNAKIAAMLESGEGLKNFYRFISQNPYINLHDACHYLERLCPVAEKNGKLQLNEKVEYDYACYAASADLKQERREQQ